MSSGSSLTCPDVVKMLLLFTNVQFEQLLVDGGKKTNAHTDTDTDCGFDSGVFDFSKDAKLLLIRQFVIKE